MSPIGLDPARSLLADQVIDLVGADKVSFPWMDVFTPPSQLSDRYKAHSICCANVRQNCWGVGEVGRKRGKREGGNARVFEPIVYSLLPSFKREKERVIE